MGADGWVVSDVKGVTLWTYDADDGDALVVEAPTGVSLTVRLHCPERTGSGVASSAEEGRRMALEMLDEMRREVVRG